MNQPAIKHRSDPQELPSLSEGLAEVSFFREQGLEQDAEACLQALRERFPEHPEIAAFEGSGSAGKPDEAASAVEDAESGGDAWDDAYIAAIFDEPAPSPRSKPRVPRPRVVTRDLDAQSTLDVGVAFQEMGLTDDAASAFRTVASAPKLGARARAMLEQLENNGGGRAPAAQGSQNERRAPKPPPISRRPAPLAVVSARPEPLPVPPARPARVATVREPSAAGNTKAVLARPARVATVREPSKPANAKSVLARPTRVAAAPTSRKASDTKVSARPSPAGEPSPQRAAAPTKVLNRPLAKVKLRKVEVPSRRAEPKPVVCPKPRTTMPQRATVAIANTPTPNPVVAPPRHGGAGLPPFEADPVAHLDPAQARPQRLSVALSAIPETGEAGPSEAAAVLQVTQPRRRPLLVTGVFVTGVLVTGVLVALVATALWPSPPDASGDSSDTNPPYAAVVASEAPLPESSPPDVADLPAPPVEAEQPAPAEVSELLDVAEDEGEADAPAEPQRRRRRSRKNRRTAESEPVPAREPAAPAEPAAPPPKVAKPPSAADLLRRASAAHGRGDTKLAYRLAKRSQDMAASPNALELMVVSACKSDMGAAARAALRGLPLSKRSKLRRTCRRHGTRIPL